MFSGFDTQLLAKALNINPQTASRLQGKKDNRNQIVKVLGHLDFVSPFTRSSGGDEDQQEDQQRQYEEEKQHKEQGEGNQDNGLEETFCSARLRQNIGDPSRADFYNPQAGRISVINSYQLPVLRHLRLSAEKGVLYSVSVYPYKYII